MLRLSTIAMVYEWMPIEEVESLLPTIEAAGVSEVARGRDGFLTAYRRLRTPMRMSMEHVPGHTTQTWSQRRDNFIARTLPAYLAAPTHRRALSLIAWAFAPPFRVLQK
jgi:hypothetical protein